MSENFSTFKCVEDFTEERKLEDSKQITIPNGVKSVIS